MGMPCAFNGCNRRATRWERRPELLQGFTGAMPMDMEVRAFCANHYGEDECPRHVASESNPKICGRCGTHVDSLRPPEEFEY